MTHTARRWITPLVVFVGLAYAVSWLIWLPQLADAQGWTDTPAWVYLHLLGGIGPAVAGITVTGWVAGRDGLRRLWRQATTFSDWRWLAVGVFGPVALFAGAVLIVAVVWTAWHVPAFGFVDGYVAMDAVGFTGLFFSFLTGAVLLTWLYNASGGNLLAAVLFHASLDITINTPTTTDLVPTAMGVLITVAGLVLLWRYGPTNLASIARQTEPPALGDGDGAEPVSAQSVPV